MTEHPMRHSLVRIRTDGAGANGTMVLAEPGCARVHGIQAMDLAFRPGEPVAARIVLMAGAVDVEARPLFHMVDPATGRLRQVRAIDWADGGRTDLDALGEIEAAPAAEPLP